MTSRDKGSDVDADKDPDETRPPRRLRRWAALILVPLVLSLLNFAILAWKPLGHGLVVVDVLVMDDANGLPCPILLLASDPADCLDHQSVLMGSAPVPAPSSSWWASIRDAATSGRDALLPWRHAEPTIWITMGGRDSPICESPRRNLVALSCVAGVWLKSELPRQTHELPRVEVEEGAILKLGAGRQARTMVLIRGRLVPKSG